MPDVDRDAPIRTVTSHGAISVDERLTLRSERDAARALGLDADPDWVWVGDVMSEDLVIAEVDEPIRDVARRMIDENVRHVGVIDRGSIVGVASMRDVLLAALD